MTTPAFVQSKSASTGSPGTTLAVTLTSSVTSGNALIAGAFDGSGINKTITYTDNVNAGNFPNSDKNQNLATDGDTCNVSSRQNCAAGSTTVTAHGGAINGIIVHEVSGLPTAAGSMVDQSASANPTSATPSSGNTAASTNATDYVFGFIGTSGSADTVTHGTGYTARETAGLGHIASEDLITSVTGVQAATFNVSPSDECAVFCVAYLSASAGGATGSAAITEGADTAAGTGSVGVSGSAVIVEGADTVSASGSVGVSGSAAILEGTDTVSASGSVGVSGSAAIIEGADTVTASGTATTGATGSAAITEGSDAVSATGSVGVSGSAAVTEGDDTVTATGSTPNSAAGRHRKWYGVRDGQKLLVFDSKVKADAARIALAERDAPKPKNRRKVKVREIPPPHEVLELPQVRRLAESQHETNTYHELLAAHSYTQLIQLHHDLKAQAQLRAQQAEEEEIAMLLLHL